VRIFRKSRYEIQLWFKIWKIMTGTLHEDLCTFIISRWILFRMRSISDKSCRENLNTQFIFTDFFENLVVYEIMWKI
jgi:hypothetical protein